MKIQYKILNWLRSLCWLNKHNKSQWVALQIYFTTPLKNIFVCIFFFVYVLFSHFWFFFTFSFFNLCWMYIFCLNNIYYHAPYLYLLITHWCYLDLIFMLIKLNKFFEFRGEQALFEVHACKELFFLYYGLIKYVRENQI